MVVSGVIPSDKGWVALAGSVEEPSAAVICRDNKGGEVGVRKEVGRERRGGRGWTDEESSGVGSERVVGGVGGVEAVMEEGELGGGQR